MSHMSDEATSDNMLITKIGRTRRVSHRLATGIAVASAAGAIAAAIVAFLQVHEASKQNIVAEQQELLQLTTTIVQQDADQNSAEDQAAGKLTGSARLSALSTVDVAWTSQLLAEGEAGAVLINELGGRGVASIEYTLVASALVTGEDDELAIRYYQDAVNAPPKSPLTEADALRGEGTVYYDLGDNARGHTLMMQAAQAYAGQQDLTRAEIADGVGQSYAEDAWNEMEAGNCTAGEAEAAEAVKVLTPVDGGDSTDGAWLASDLTALKRYC